MTGTIGNKKSGSGMSDSPTGLSVETLRKAKKTLDNADCSSDIVVIVHPDDCTKYTLIGDGTESVAGVRILKGILAKWSA